MTWRDAIQAAVLVTIGFLMGYFKRHREDKE